MNIFYLVYFTQFLFWVFLRITVIKTTKCVCYLFRILFFKINRVIHLGLHLILTQHKPNENRNRQMSLFFFLTSTTVFIAFHIHYSYLPIADDLSVPVYVWNEQIFSNTFTWKHTANEWKSLIRSHIAIDRTGLYVSAARWPHRRTQHSIFSWKTTFLSVRHTTLFTINSFPI